MVDILSSSRSSDCDDAALVLAAAGIRHETVHVDGVFLLRVRGEDAMVASRELRRYARENPDTAPEPEPPPLILRSRGWPGALVYALVLGTLFAIQIGDVVDVEWVRVGKAHAGAIQHGQWWRTITALTLHADIGHVAGNIVFGGLFGMLLAQAWGDEIAWSAMLFSGVLGNALSAAIKPAGFAAIGASTAVFGALGALTTWYYLRGRHARQGRLRRWAPLVAGVILLAMHGTGGERTDVLSHVTGFVAGGVIAVVHARWLESRAPSAPVRCALALAPFAVIAAAWAIALTR